MKNAVKGRNTFVLSFLGLCLANVQGKGVEVKKPQRYYVGIESRKDLSRWRAKAPRCPRGVYFLKDRTGSGTKFELPITRAFLRRIKYTFRIVSDVLSAKESFKILRNVPTSIYLKEAWGVSLRGVVPQAKFLKKWVHQLDAFLESQGDLRKLMLHQLFLDLSQRSLLEERDLSRKDVEEAAQKFLKIISRLPKLEKLELDVGRLSGQGISHVVYSLNGFKNLKMLCLRLDPDEDRKMLSRGCFKQLRKKLHLIRIEEVSDFNEYGGAHEFIRSLIESFCLKKKSQGDQRELRTEVALDVSMLPEGEDACGNF